MKVLSTTTSQPRLCAIGADGGDVGEPHQRIGRRLDVDVARVLADGALHVARIGRVHVGELEAEVRHDLVEQPRHAAVEIVGGDDVIAGLHQWQSAPTAAIPLAKTGAAMPPSSDARFCSRRVRVGLPARE